MRRSDLIAMERYSAATYRREAKAREGYAPDVAARLRQFADTADARCEELRAGPLFRSGE